MNKAKLIELMESGAFFKVSEFKIYHPSFRKGYRSLSAGDISWVAAQKVLKNKLTYADGVYKIAAA